MALNIYRLYNKRTDISEETKQADQIADAFEDFFPRNASGDIYILPSMACAQARNKDLDLVIWFNTPDLIMEVSTGVHGNTFPQKRKVQIKSALLVLELKSHNTYHSIRIQNQNLELKYPEGYHNVTQQSEGQKYALINFLKERIGLAPFVNNLIWLYNAGNINHHDAHLVENILWGNPNPKKLFQVVFRNNLPKQQEDGTIVYDAAFNEKLKNDCSDYFETIRKNTAIDIGRISRKKVHELISKEIADMERLYFNSIGNKLTIIKGNPGTGKTIHLVHLANNLRIKRSLKSLILTFNKALQQDIKRLLHFSGLGNENEVNILTWDAFAYMCLLEYETPEPDGFAEWTDKLLDLIKTSDNPRNDFKTVQKYDCILIDEGQDWSNVKKEIIYALFGYQYAIISIGMNQMVESQTEQNWAEGIGRDERQEYYLDVSHRNKVNIVNFLQELAIDSNYDWDLIKNKQLVGGRVVICNEYSYEIHSNLVKDLQDNDNSFYDMMFLGGTKEELFTIKNTIESYGHHGFIASKEENRNKMFPLDKFRIISYQACRGLEGWTIICYEWDTYIEDILKNISNKETDEIIRNQFFIVMTRAIDTLVIHLKNPESSLSQQIIHVAKRLIGTSEITISNNH